ncbi:MAG: MBOAT family O-acyltransferase, partial [Planctomycetota bacterium]
GTWNWMFLSLIVLSTVIDSICGLQIHRSNDLRKRKLFLFISMFSNLSLLGFFKYFNFFVESLQDLVGCFGVSLDARFMNIILPVGISFYTFQTMSYTIDIYRKELEPTNRFFDFALFVSFFPQLVAGPIERAKRLLPQVLEPRKLHLDPFYQGCYLIFWGLFLKIFIADNLAPIVDSVFRSAAPYNGAEVLIALYGFAFQIFCDFAGYSNIARGLGKCMGFDIMINFNVPYFSTNPPEFWQRWHISLSSWLRDYLYIPLGGNRDGALKTYRNLALTMLLGGLWHGAAWTFVFWGAYQGALLIIHRLCSPWLGKVFAFKNAAARGIWFGVRVVIFFQLVCVGWLIFRAESMSQIFQMLYSLFFHFHPTGGLETGSLLFYTGLLIAVQAVQYATKDLLFIMRFHPVVRGLFYVLCFYLFILFGATGGKEFIYFQF